MLCIKKSKRILWLLMLCICCLLGLSVYAQENDEIQKRIDKAYELGLQEWVDGEGYLIDRFYDGKSDEQITGVGLDGLVRTMSDEEIAAYFENLRQGISFFKVSSYQKASQKNPATGVLLYTGIFEVDGILAFCIERSQTTPPKHSPTGPPIEMTNEDLRKVLYHGYNGPAYKGYTFVETAMAAAEANGDGDNSLGRIILAEIVQLEPAPSNFKVWKVETNDGLTQDLAYYTIVEEGTGQIQKVSKYESMTDNNSNYSLQGAVFGVYSDAACTMEVKRVTTNEEGLSDAFQLAEGIYYVKEITAPPGFKLNSEIISITIEASKTTILTIEEEPKSIVPDLLLQKVDSETRLNLPQGKGTLQGAEFLVKFYKGSYESKEALQGITASKQWTFRTDVDGKIRFQTEYLVEGDSFWLDLSNNVILPRGTLTIQETKSSNGYRICEEVFFIPIREGQASIPVIEIAEENIQLVLTKYQGDTENVLEGAVFEHRSPDGTVEQLVTGESGTIVCKGLQRGMHTIKEVSAPEGYALNENVVNFEIDESGEVIVQCEVKEQYGKVQTILDEKGNLIIEMEDRVGQKLPETGDVKALWFVCVGVLSCSLSAVWKKWKKRRTI